MDYTSPKYTNDLGGIQAERTSDGVSEYFAPGSEKHKQAVAGDFGPIEAYQPPPEPTPEDILASERATMRCTPAQMRLTLHRAGLLSQVQAIADADPEASIVWEYATEIVRNSPLIDALGGENGFTPEEIDDLFRQAMAVKT